MIAATRSPTQNSTPRTSNASSSTPRTSSAGSLTPTSSSGTPRSGTPSGIDGLSEKDLLRAVKRRNLRAALNREATEVKFLANLAFVPCAQRWARDYSDAVGSRGGIAGSADNSNNDNGHPHGVNGHGVNGHGVNGHTGGGGDAISGRNNLNPDLVSHVVVLRRPSAFASFQRTAAKTLRDDLLRQFEVAGLRVCLLNTSEVHDDSGAGSGGGLVGLGISSAGGGAAVTQADSFFGLYALQSALVEEKRNMMSDNILSWNSDSLAELPAHFTVSPAERMLLTLRIITRAINFVRDRRDEEVGFRGKPSLFRTLAEAFCPQAGCLKFDDVQVQCVVPDAKTTATTTTTTTTSASA